MDGVGSLPLYLVSIEYMIEVPGSCLLILDSAIFQRGVQSRARVVLAKASECISDQLDPVLLLILLHSIKWDALHYRQSVIHNIPIKDSLLYSERLWI